MNTYKIFTYGTLSIPEVMQAVGGGVYSRSAACLPGFERMLLRGKIYPGILCTGQGFTEGVLHSGVTSFALDRLDFFEDEIYRRQIVQVVLADGTTARAYAYVVPSELRELLSAEPWCEAAFLRHHLSNYLDRVDCWMQAYTPTAKYHTYTHCAFE